MSTPDGTTNTDKRALQQFTEETWHQVNSLLEAKDGRLLARLKTEGKQQPAMCWCWSMRPAAAGPG